jgi:hypothetical protein
MQLKKWRHKTYNSNAIPVIYNLNVHVIKRQIMFEDGTASLNSPGTVRRNQL